MTDDDILVAHLARLKARPRLQRREAARLLADEEPAARRAQWAFGHYLRRARVDRTVPEDFVGRYLASCREAVLHLANGADDRIGVDLPSRPDGMLFACWHFPEYPILLEAASRTNTLVLVASEHAWMEHLRRQGCLLCFRSGQFSGALGRAFRARRPVFAMLDYCYESSRHVVADFLSYPARTPVGVLRLAARSDYRIGLVSVRGRTLRVVQTIPTAGRAVEEIAGDLNAGIAREILRRPARWLLWPAVTQRWVGVDYDG